MNLLVGLVLTAILSIPANYSLTVLLSLRSQQLINSAFPTKIIDICWYLIACTWIAFWLIVGVKIGKSKKIILGIIIGILV